MFGRCGLSGDAEQSKGPRGVLIIAEGLYGKVGELPTCCGATSYYGITSYSQPTFFRGLNIAHITLSFLYQFSHIFRSNLQYCWKYHRHMLSGLLRKDNPQPSITEVVFLYHQRYLQYVHPNVRSLLV